MCGCLKRKTEQGSNTVCVLSTGYRKTPQFFTAGSFCKDFCNERCWQLRQWGESGEVCVCMVHRISNKYNRKQMSHSSLAAFKRFATFQQAVLAFLWKKINSVGWKLVLAGIYFMVKSSKHTPWLPDLFFSDVVLTKRHHRGPHSHFRGPTAISGGFQGHLRGPDRHPMGSVSHIKDPRATLGVWKPSQGPQKVYRIFNSIKSTVKCFTKCLHAVCQYKAGYWKRDEWYRHSSKITR